MNGGCQWEGGSEQRSVEIAAPETELASGQAETGQGSAWTWPAQHTPGQGLSSWASAPREVEAKQQGTWDRRCFYLTR